MPLSYSTDSTGIDETGEDIETQLAEKVISRKFTLQMDESTVVDSETLLPTYVRYINKGDVAEQMSFCTSLDSSFITIDIYYKLENYLDDIIYQ